MKKTLVGYEQISRIFKPTFAQMSLSKFFEDPLNVFLMNEGTTVKLYDKHGRATTAFARSQNNGLVLSCRLPSSSFEYGRKILIFLDVGPQSYALQAIVKSAHMGDLYVEDTPTRFYPRFATMLRATACPLPQHFISNIIQGKWYVERTTEEKTNQRLKVTDGLLEWKTSKPIENLNIDNQSNVLVTSISRGGFGLTRNVHPTSRPLKYFVLNSGYYHKGDFVQLELLAIARNSSVENGVETINCCLISPLPSLSDDIFPFEARVKLQISDKAEVYLNGDIKGHTDSISLLVPPGRHKIKLVTKEGDEFTDRIHINSFENTRGKTINYRLFSQSPFRCDASEQENDTVIASGI